MTSRYRTIVRDVPYVVGAVGLIGIVVLISGAILTRNFEIRVRGLQMASQLVGVWLTFIVAGGLAYERRHIEIDYFADMLDGPVRYYHTLAVLALNLLLGLVLAVGGLIAMDRFWESTAPNAPIPIPIYYAAIVLGGLLLAVVYGQRLVATIRGESDEPRSGDARMDDA